MTLPIPLRHTIYLLAALVLLATWLPPAAAGTLTLSAAINEAGRQRMLTQRIVKAHLQEGLGVQPRRARAQKRAAIALFDARLAQLRDFEGTDAVRGALARVDSLWAPFKRLAEQDVHRGEAGAERCVIRLKRDGERLLEASHRVVLALEAMSDRTHARLVNLSGRQRMLSQRLAKLYMLKAWGLARPEIDDQMDRAESEFEGALAQIATAPENDPGIREQLHAVREQWGWLKASLRVQQDTYFPLVVEDASEKTVAPHGRGHATLPGPLRGRRGRQLGGYWTRQEDNPEPDGPPGTGSRAIRPDFYHNFAYSQRVLDRPRSRHRVAFCSGIEK